MKSTVLSDTLQVLMGVALGAVGIFVINEAGQVNLLRIFGYALAIAAFIIAGRGAHRSFFRRYPTPREMVTFALFAVAAIAGQQLIVLLPENTSWLVGQIYVYGLAALFIRAAVRHWRTLSPADLPDTNQAGMPITEPPPRRWPPP